MVYPRLSDPGVCRRVEPVESEAARGAGQFPEAVCVESAFLCESLEFPQFLRAQVAKHHDSIVDCLLAFLNVVIAQHVDDHGWLNARSPPSGEIFTRGLELPKVGKGKVQRP